MSDKDQGTLEIERRVALKSLLAGLPENYAGRYAVLQKLRHAFHQEMASVLEPALNRHIADKPQDSAAERKELSGWVNQQLRDIGLAVQCPNTKQPSLLVVDWKYADDPEVTRFRFSTRSEKGKTRNTAASGNLPYLHLTEHLPRIESFARYFRRKLPDALQR